jgi:hypothetical protein
LISRLRKTCVAFEPVPPAVGKRKRGRHRGRPASTAKRTCRSVISFRICRGGRSAA